MIQNDGHEQSANNKTTIEIPSRLTASRVSPAVFLPSPVVRGGGAFLLEAEVSLPYFRLWVDNWRASPRVQGMTYFQRGIFIEMLSLSWQMGPLPLNSLPILLKLNPRSWRIAWQFPLNSCWVETEKGLINERLEEERVWAKSRTNIGKMAARHRWDRHADAMQTHSEGNAIPDPDPDPDPDPKKEEKRKKKPQFDVKWNGKDDFIGPDSEALKTHIKERYVEELGSAWVNAIWALIIEWCQDYPKKIAAKKDDGAFVVGWYRRDAKDERKGQKQKAAAAYTTWEGVAFGSPTSDQDKARQRGKIEACEKEHGQHRDGELKPGSHYAFCRHECGYHKPLKELVT